MLLLTRKTNQAIVIGENVTVRIIEIRGDQVRLGIVAPKQTPIRREELPPRSELQETAA